MKKILIVVGVIIALIVVIVAGCLGFGAWKASEYMAKSNEVTAKIIGNEVPGGFMTLFADDNLKQSGNSSAPDAPNAMAFLMSTTGMMVFIIDGPAIGSEEEKQAMIETFKSQMQQRNQSSARDVNLEITENGQIEINGKMYTKYAISGTSNGSPLSGLAVFIDHDNNTLFYICAGDSKVYNEQSAEEFARVIKK